MNEKLAGTIISLLFEARTIAHQLHLQTTSFSIHKALDEYYHDIVERADALAENLQGRYGIIKKFPSISLDTDSPVELVENVISWIDANRMKICDEPEIQNLIDEVQNLNNSTLYKLKNLK